MSPERLFVDVRQNVDFADAYHGAWMLAHGIDTACTFDRKHFRRLPGITVLQPGGDPAL